jgi:hypothetical protein
MATGNRLAIEHRTRCYSYAPFSLSLGYSMDVLKFYGKRFKEATITPGLPRGGATCCLALASTMLGRPSSAESPLPADPVSARARVFPFAVPRYK